MEKLKIVIQKQGRLTDGSLDFLNRLGLNLQPNGRELIMKSTSLPVEVILVRDDDIPTYVAQGTADFGIVGENEYKEKGFNLKVQDRLGFAKCKLVIAVPEQSKFQSISDLDRKRIATSYPKILREYLARQGVQSEIVEISGSVEIAPTLGIADGIFDITQSGRTLKENALKIISEVLNSEAILVESKIDKPLKQQFLNLIQKS